METKEAIDEKMIDLIKKVWIGMTTRSNCKISKRHSRMAIMEMRFLDDFIKNTLNRDDYGRPKSFNVRGMLDVERGSFFFSLGALIAIYEGISGGEEFVKTLKEFVAAVYEAL
jgi:hypothetical protein